MSYGNVASTKFLNHDRGKKNTPGPENDQGTGQDIGDGDPGSKTGEAEPCGAKQRQRQHQADAKCIGPQI